MSERAYELAPRWAGGLGGAGRAGLAPSAFTIDRPTALGTSASGNPGEARLLITASMRRATTTAPALARDEWFTAPSSPTGPCGRSRTRSAATRAPPPRPAPAAG